MFNLIVQFCYNTQTDRFLFVGFRNKKTAPLTKRELYNNVVCYLFLISEKLAVGGLAVVLGFGFFIG